MRQPSWDDLRIFAAVARAGSLSAAAVQLGSSQPTVGRRLRALEAELGVRLVERISNRIALTAAGERLRDRTLAMAEAAELVVREAAVAAGTAPRPVVVSATGSVSLFLARHAAELRRRLGDVPITVASSKERANLAAREADIAIRMRHLPADGDLVARKLARVGFALYGPAGRSTGSLPVVGLPVNDRRPSQAGHVDDWAAGRAGRIPVRFADVGQRYLAISASPGITLLPCWLGDSDRSLARIAAPPAELQEDLYLLVRRDARTEVAIVTVLDCLAALFRRHAGRLLGVRKPVWPRSRSR